MMSMIAMLYMNSLNIHSTNDDCTSHDENVSYKHDIPEFALDKVLDFDLEEIYVYCAVNFIENPCIANYIKSRNQIENEDNTN